MVRLIALVVLYMLSLAARQIKLSDIPGARVKFYPIASHKDLIGVSFALIGARKDVEVKAPGKRDKRMCVVFDILLGDGELYSLFMDQNPSRAATADYLIANPGVQIEVVMAERPLSDGRTFHDLVDYEDYQDYLKELQASASPHDIAE